MSSGSWAGATGVQGKGLGCSQEVPRGSSRDPKCRQGSLGCWAGGLGVAKGLWCIAGLVNMQSKCPGCSPSSWVLVLGAGQESQGCRAGLSGGGRVPGCGSRLPRVQLGVQSRVLGHSRGAEQSQGPGVQPVLPGVQHQASAGGVLGQGRAGRALVLPGPIEQGVVEGAGVGEHELDSELHLLVVLLPGVDGEEEQAAAHLAAHHQEAATEAVELGAGAGARILHVQHHLLGVLALQWAQLQHLLLLLGGHQPPLPILLRHLLDAHLHHCVGQG